MIRISQIDDEYRIYKESIVVLTNKGAETKEMIDLLRYHKIHISYVCDKKMNNWGKIFGDIPIISPAQLKIMLQNKNQQKVVVQFTTNKANEWIEELLDSINCDSFISVDEALNVFTSKSFYNSLKADPKTLKNFISNNSLTRVQNKNNPNNQGIRNYLKEHHLDNQINIICTMPKTGDNTLTGTFNKNGIPYFIIWHRPEQLDISLLKESNKKVKIITGVRDPISQNLSLCYERLSRIDTPQHNMFIYSLKEDGLFKDGGNAQEIFDLMYKKSEDIAPISNFMDRFKENKIDLSKQVFDKDLGYSIIKDDNIEIFVYQLEKLNNLTQEISNWIGQNSFNEWTLGNIGENKWSAKSYAQAQKEIIITQEHFDLCYNDPWVHHFYSQEDIEKFKDRWRPHIK